jgi:hypothetical protein
MNIPHNLSISNYRIKKLRALEARHDKADRDHWELAEKYQSQGWAWYAATSRPDVVALQKLKNEQSAELREDAQKGCCTICQEKVDRKGTRPAVFTTLFFKVYHLDCYYTLYPERYADDMQRKRNAISL